MKQLLVILMLFGLTATAQENAHVTNFNHPSKEEFKSSFVLMLTPVTYQKTGKMDVPFTIALSLFDGMSIIDIAITRTCVGTGKGYEANPLMQSIAGNPPWDMIVKGTGVILANYLVKLAYNANPTIGWVTVGVLDGLMMGVLYNNYQVSLSVSL